MNKVIIKAKEFGIEECLIDEHVLTAIKSIQSQSFDAYIVGGAIRDLLLNHKPKDYDLVTNATPVEICKIFPRSLIIGKRFKIVHVYQNRLLIEISTYRSDLINSDAINITGRVVSNNSYGTLDEDAQRRDYTVNALYYDPYKEIIIDYHNSINDIKNKTLNIIGEPYRRYLEDPVRILRAIRIATKLNLSIPKDTYINFVTSKILLSNESKGRLFDEMTKILLSGHSLNIIRELIELNIPKSVFPIFDELFFCHTINSFAVSVLEKTDERLQNSHISLNYLMSALVWAVLYEKCKITNKEELNTALRENSHIKDMTVARNMNQAIVDILYLHLELIGCRDSEMYIQNSHFRHALHLIAIRYEFNQIDMSIYEYWSQYL